MEKFGGYFRKFESMKEAEARAERFARGKILKSAQYRSQSDLSQGQSSARTGFFGNLMQGKDDIRSSHNNSVRKPTFIESAREDKILSKNKIIRKRP